MLFKKYFGNNNSNSWIIKPSSLSRGRGIGIFDNILKIEHYIFSSDCEFIAQ